MNHLRADGLNKNFRRNIILTVEPRLIYWLERGRSFFISVVRVECSSETILSMFWSVSTRKSSCMEVR